MRCDHSPHKTRQPTRRFLGEEGQAGPLDLRRVDHQHPVHAVRRGLHRRAAVDRHRGGAEWPHQTLGGERSVDAAAMCRGLRLFRFSSLSLLLVGILSLLWVPLHILCISFR